VGRRPVSPTRSAARTASGDAGARTHGGGGGEAEPWGAVAEVLLPQVLVLGIPLAAECAAFLLDGGEYEQALVGRRLLSGLELGAELVSLRIPLAHHAVLIVEKL
jgi:hypothetical protein